MESAALPTELPTCKRAVVAIRMGLVKNGAGFNPFSSGEKCMLVLKNESGAEMFYATRESAGFDIAASEAVTIPPGEWRLVPTGLRIVENAPPQEMRLGSFQVTVLPELQIRPRSGLAVKFGITILNTPSTIDADYRGEIKIPIVNHSRVSFNVHPGDRIAQGVCALVFHAPNICVMDVVRGEGGFGSTGGKSGLTS